MVEAGATLRLIRALNEGADTSRFRTLLSDRELARTFPALGIPTSVGLSSLVAVSQELRPEPATRMGREIRSYLEGLRAVEREFSAFAEHFRSHEDEVVASAWSRAARLLPPVEAPRHLRLVFLPLGLDFRTDGETVYMDPLASVSLGLEGVGVTLAHELHHVGRFLVTGENLTLMEPYARGRLHGVPDVLRNWASWLESEGIADCVSNVTETDVPVLHDVVERRRRQLGDVPALLSDSLEKLGAALDQGPAGADALEELDRDLRALAHPIGAGMAGAIRSLGGTLSLVGCVGRPKVFLQRYNDAALGTAHPRFGDRLFELW